MMIVRGSSHLSTIDPVKPIGSCTCRQRTGHQNQQGLQRICAIFFTHSQGNTTSWKGSVMTDTPSSSHHSPESTQSELV